MHASIWSINKKQNNINQMGMQKGSPLIKLNSFDHACLALLHILILVSPAVTGQPVVTPAMEPDNNKSVITIMAIVIVMFLISAFLSLYSRKCSDRQDQTNGANQLNLAAAPTGTTVLSQVESNGLNQATIDTFPMFLYSDVKGLKIGKDTLACAVCLNEFEDDETLRMIPKCCHVYHPHCIDTWLTSHTTCPVCRANLVPQPEDITNLNTNMNMNMPPMFSIQIPDEEEHESEYEHENENVSFEEQKRESDVDLLRRIRSLHQSRPSRSRSTGFLSSLLFPRSNSMGQLAQPGENYERFTLRLPEEVRSQMVNSTTLKRANSCVCFTRLSSGTWGYRTRSVGSARGRGCVQYERFNGCEEQWGFTLTPPSLVRNGWNRFARKSPVRGDD